MTLPVMHVTGARPNFPKAAPVLTALDALGVPQLLVHTGQHYDDRLSEVFFRELDLPRPDVNLGIGSGSHAVQTAAVMVEIERILQARPVSLVVVYGDVNSTVAAALVAAKLHVPVAHVEAGLRSHDMTMPEEVNRRVTDALCELLFVTSVDAVAHLAAEGVPPERIHFVGNPMIDTLLAQLDRLDSAAARAAHGLPERYVVATLHRPSNVDGPDDAGALVRVLTDVAGEVDVVLPLHPRGRGALEAAGLRRVPKMHIRNPLGYRDFLSLVMGAAAVLTDSGGVQEETTVLGVPCLTMRPNTERPVTITHGTNVLVDRDDVVAVLRSVLTSPVPRAHRVPPLWDGAAGPRIAGVIAEWLAVPARPVIGVR